MTKTVMIVDDSISLRKVVSMALRNAGYEVLEASDGQDCLAKLEGQRIHLIISDVNMPGMDGLTMARHIKSMPAYKFIPIIMLTTEGSEQLKNTGREIGVKAWILKPFQPYQMLDAVTKLILP
jgi:two-component system chemotaxis response regulator CheY